MMGWMREEGLRSCVVGSCVFGEGMTVEGKDLRREGAEDGWFGGAKEKSGKGSVSWGWSRREESRGRGVWIGASRERCVWREGLCEKWLGGEDLRGEV